jgi:hypothetical protein
VEKSKNVQSCIHESDEINVDFKESDLNLGNHCIMCDKIKNSS